jgi:hypothetical protein
VSSTWGACAARLRAARAASFGSERASLLRAQKKRPNACGGVTRWRSLGRARRKQKQKQAVRPPNYRVLLHNDSLNKREYVVQVLLKAR